MRTGVLHAAAAALLVLLAAPPAALAARIDVIVLRNGDRVTGEVIQMRQGKLQLKTDDAGTLSIEWDKITAVTTAAQYDITLSNGTQLYGRMRPGTPYALEVVSDAGKVTPISMAEVVFLAQIKPTFFSRIDGSMDLGASYTKSSGVGQLSFEADAEYRRPSDAVAAALSTNLTRQPDAPESSRYTANLGYTRYRNDGWFVSGLGLFEGNRDLGFTFRGTGAGSLGRYLTRSNRAEVWIGGGMAIGREVPVGDDTVTNVDALAVMNLAIFAYDFPNTKINFGLLAFPSLDDPGRVRLNADGKLKRELFRDFYFSLSAYDAFDNRPKAASAEKNDFGATVSFGWSF